METLKSGIYGIENSKTKEIYIGQAYNIEKRKRVHYSLLKNNKHHNKHLQSSYNKYGKETFKFIVLLYCNKENMTMFEQLVVDFCIEKNIKIYNFLFKCVDSWFGMNHSEETIKKIKEKVSGEKNHNYGKSFSEEHKRKIGESNKGKIRTSEWIENLSKSHIGKSVGEKNANSKLTDFQRREIIKLLKETNKTQKEIADIYSVDRTTIGKIKKGAEKYAS